MDIIAGWAQFETTYRGEPVSMQLRPLYAAGYRLIFPYMREYKDKGEAVDNILEMLGKAREVFDGHVKDITGLTINGAQITAEDLSREVVLSPLAQAILQELFLRSTVTAGEAKNSEGPLTSSTA